MGKGNGKKNGNKYLMAYKIKNILREKKNAMRCSVK